MKYNNTFREALKKVREAPDHEISMARGELKATADKALELVAALEGKSDEGNPMEAWVQSKITKAKDYVNSVYDYLMYNPNVANEEVKPEEDKPKEEDGPDYIRENGTVKYNYTNKNWDILVDGEIVHTSNNKIEANSIARGDQPIPVAA